MIELTTSEGSDLLLVASTIWAIENSPNEKFTLLKTAAEPLGVMETPAIIVERMKELYEAREKAMIERQQEALAFNDLATATATGVALDEADPPEDPHDVVGQEWYDRQMGVDPDDER